MRNLLFIIGCGLCLLFFPLYLLSIYHAFEHGTELATTMTRGEVMVIFSNILGLILISINNPADRDIK